MLRRAAAAATALHTHLQVVSLRSSHTGVRAAAIEAAADLTVGGGEAGSADRRLLQLAADSPALLSGVLDLWEGVADALTGG